MKHVCELNEFVSVWWTLLFVSTAPVTPSLVNASFHLWIHSSPKVSPHDPAGLHPISKILAHSNLCITSLTTVISSRMITRQRSGPSEILRLNSKSLNSFATRDLKLEERSVDTSAALPLPQQGRLPENRASAEEVEPIEEVREISIHDIIWPLH